MPDEPKKTERAVAVFIYSFIQKRFLVLHRNKWEDEGTPLLFPGGGVNDNEDDIDAAYRETREEIGRCLIKECFYHNYTMLNTKWTKKYKVYKYDIGSLNLEYYVIELEQEKFSGYLWLPLDDHKLLRKFLPLFMPGSRSYIEDVILKN